MSDRVTLSVPSRSEFARTVRMTASELASRMGMSYDDVEDVRLAAEEAFVYAAETTRDEDQVTIDFIVGGDEFELDGRSRLGVEVQRRRGRAQGVVRDVHPPVRVRPVRAVERR